MFYSKTIAGKRTSYFYGEKFGYEKSKNKY